MYDGSYQVKYIYSKAYYNKGYKLNYFTGRTFYILNQ